MRLRPLPSIFSASAFIIGASLVFSAARPWAAQTPENSDVGIDASSYRLDERSGVPICWNSDETIFPRAKEFEMSATPLSEVERERSLRVVQEALKRYPVALLNQDLKAVFVVKALHFRGIAGSGTYDGQRVYLANGGAKAGFTDQWMGQVFHAEFSSVLFWRHAKLFNKDAWQDCNSPGFVYGGNGVNAIKNGLASTKPQAEWWTKGFMNQYATASMEEDFNSMVKYLFSHPPTDRPVLAVSTQLQQKAVLVEEFYRKLGVEIDAPIGSIQ